MLGLFRGDTAQTPTGKGGSFLFSFFFTEEILT